MTLIHDLFSGTGSATQPFVECGKHRVVRVDIDPRCHPDIVADVRKLPGFLLRERPEFVWASPPCTEFSQLTFLRPTAHPGMGPPDPEKGMELVRVAFEAAGRARKWVLENVRRSEQFISPEFGPPMLRKDAWCLWGNVDGFLLGDSSRWFKGNRQGPGTERPGRWGIKRARKYTRAIIPRPLASAVHRAVCEA